MAETVHGAGATSLRRRNDNGDGGRERSSQTTSSHDRQHAEFGGISWASTLFGWLAAAGLTAILAGILGAAGAALALNEAGGDVSGAEAETIGLASGIALLVVLAIAYFLGGYAAGRMARSTVRAKGLASGCGASSPRSRSRSRSRSPCWPCLGGSKYNVLDALNFPRLPVRRRDRARRLDRGDARRGDAGRQDRRALSSQGRPRWSGRLSGRRRALRADTRPQPAARGPQR